MNRRFIFCRTAILCLTLGFLFPASGFATAIPQPDPDDAYWDDQFQYPGLDADAGPIAFDEAGNMYVGVDSYENWYLTAHGIVKWDGRVWSNLGAGLTERLNLGYMLRAYAILPVGTDIYVGGNFQKAGNVIASCIAKWDGTSWSAVGAGFDDLVYDLEYHNGQLYAGGRFRHSGVVAVNGVARWNGTGWVPLDVGVNGGVMSLKSMASDLYVGGYFTTAGGAAAQNIARWSGSSWSAVGGGINGYVSDLEVWGGQLYSGGEFTMAGGKGANNVARWNGLAWSAVGIGTDASVFDLTSAPDGLYAGGWFEHAGGISALHLAKWNGTSWQAVGGGVGEPGSGWVYAVESKGTELYAGGWFDQAGGDWPLWNIVKWDGSRWSTLGSGIAGYTVNALTVSGSEVYIGGGFYTIGGIVANSIAKWNGEAWSALGPGLENEVCAVLVDGTEVYAAGGHRSHDFHYVSKWDGVEWQDVGGPLNTTRIYSLALMGADLYAGVEYASSGGGLLKWDGSSWTIPGGGITGTVYDMIVSGTDLYLGGTFGVRRWDGSAYHELGSGINGTVEAFVFDENGHLYAGGTYTMAGGIPASSIAKWDGSAWTPVGSGKMSYVKSLAVSGNKVYAGGWFQKEFGYPANGVAAWDGEKWCEFGSGTPSAVEAIALVGETLLIGGRMVYVGGKVSFGLGRWMPRVHTTTFTLSENPVPKTTVEAPDTVTFGLNPYAFYQPALILDSGTTVAYTGGLPTDATIEMADEVCFRGVRLNGAFTISPAGVTFGGTGALLRIEFGEHDAVAFGTTPSDFRAVHITYPPDYPGNQEAIVELLSDERPVPVRIQNQEQVYAITVPISGIQSTYAVVPLSALPVTGTENWEGYD